VEADDNRKVDFALDEAHGDLSLLTKTHNGLEYQVEGNIIVVMTNKNKWSLPSIGKLLGFANQGSRTLSERRLREHDLTLQQWIVLTVLWRETPVKEGELGGYSKMSPSSLNRLLDRMESKGLVERTRDEEDRRRVLVSIGPEGQALSGLLNFYEEINNVITDGMTPEEVRQLVELLKRVVENLEGALEE
jgi:DNA-binding MarR family transcriptional regulator